MDKTLQIINQLGIKIAQLEITNAELTVEIKNLQKRHQETNNKEDNNG